MLEDLENLPKIFEEWEKRDKLINASRGAEFVLSFRRAILDLAVQLQSNTNAEINIITGEIGKLWLKSAKIARKYVNVKNYNGVWLGPLLLNIYSNVSLLSGLDYTNKHTCIFCPLPIHVRRKTCVLSKLNCTGRKDLTKTL